MFDDTNTTVFQQPQVTSVVPHVVFPLTLITRAATWVLLWDDEMMMIMSTTQY